MAERVISVRGLGKRYRVGTREVFSDSLFHSGIQLLTSPFENFRKLKNLTRFAKDDSSVFWALKDIDFEVEVGQVLGIIGHNGAGKSTLLKILSRITEPTLGEVRLKGRVSSLLEVGTGFHPDLTGRENVFMNGTILGMTKQEIDRKFDEIVAFSGVEQYIDTPVKFYSSGMKVRLGFAVAAHLEPEILIVDEVLSVGDIGFQRKCIGKMNEVAGGGRTVLFVSHNMAAVENLCTSALLLDHGKTFYMGAVHDTVQKYISLFRPQTQDSFLADGVERVGNGKVTIKDFWLEDNTNVKVDMAKTGEVVYLNFGIQSEIDSQEVDLGFSIHREEDDQMLFILYSSYTGKTFQLAKGTSTVKCKINSLPLPEGRFLVKAQVMSRGQILDFPKAGVGFMDVIEGDFYGTGQKSNKLTREQPLFLVNGNWM